MYIHSTIINPEYVWQKKKRKKKNKHTCIYHYKRKYIITTDETIL